tara:strand:+ start:27 stop:596 length:570 start_codon:yes stop_codon:yes gene_type:complete
MPINILFNKILITAFLCLLLIFSSCGIYKKTDARTTSTNANERVKKNMEEGSGFRLGNIGKNRSGEFQFASANPLWRASLEKLDFAPLNNVDYGGGIIVTDWFGNETANEQIKITIRFLTNELRSDAIDVIIHKKTCNTTNNCKTVKINSNLNAEIKFAILKKAAQIKKQDLTKRKDDKSNKVKLPKNF